MCVRRKENKDVVLYQMLRARYATVVVFGLIKAIVLMFSATFMFTTYELITNVINIAR